MLEAQPSRHLPAMKGSISKENIQAYQNVLSTADPSGQVPSIEEIQSAFQQPKSVRKTTATLAIQDGLKPLFQKLHAELDLTPDETAKLVNQTARKLGMENDKTQCMGR